MAPIRNSLTPHRVKLSHEINNSFYYTNMEYYNNYEVNFNLSWLGGRRPGERPQKRQIHRVRIRQAVKDTQNEDLNDILGVKWNRCLQSSQYSLREYRSHCTRQSWWMNLILPVHIQGWKSGRSLVPSHLHTRHISAKQLQYIPVHILTLLLQEMQ